MREEKIATLTADLEISDQACEEAELEITNLTAKLNALTLENDGLKFELQQQTTIRLQLEQTCDNFQILLEKRTADDNNAMMLLKSKLDAQHEQAISLATEEVQQLKNELLKTRDASKSLAASKNELRLKQELQQVQQDYE
jgi:hypothetical protein